MMEDLANMFKTKFDLDVGRTCLYQRSYSDDFDLVPYPASQHVPEFINFSGDDNRMTWEHISQNVAQFGEASVGVLLSGSPRGIPRRVVVSRDLPRSKRDGARNTKIQTGSGRRSVIPYVLCGGLYSLRCCLMCLILFWWGPCSPLYNLGEQDYMESPSQVRLESYSEWIKQFPCTSTSFTPIRVDTKEVGHNHVLLPTLEYSTPVSSPAARV